MAAVPIQSIGGYDVEIGYDLGSGTFGTVFEGYVHGNEQEKVAVKRIKVLDEVEFTKTVEKEFQILQSMATHRNIVQVICMERSVIPKDFVHIYMWMFMELCELGNMRSFCIGNTLSITQKVSMMCQCADAVLFLHKQGHVHRDIKPENILLTGDRTRPTVKLTDFGTARAIESIQGREKTLHSFVGTESYMAPELFSQVVDGTEPAYDKTADTFSLGLTFVAVTEAKVHTNLNSFKADGKEIGKRLWTTKQDTESIMKPDDSSFQRELKEIFTKMLRFERRLRLSMEKVLQQLQEIQRFFSDPILVTSGGYCIGADSNQINQTDVMSMYRKNTWHDVTTLPTECHYNGVSVCAVEDGLVFIGGDKPEGDNPTANCNHYSVFCEKWNTLADIPTTQAYGSAIAIKKSVYCMGGLGPDDSPTAPCYKLNMEEKKWSTICKLKVPMVKPLIAKACGKIYVVPSKLTYQYIREGLHVQCYNPETNTLTQKSAYTSGNLASCLVSVNDMLYLLGSVDCQQYNPSNDQWTAISMPATIEAWFHPVAATYGSRIVLFTGEKAYEYNTAADGTWRDSEMRLPQIPWDKFCLKHCVVAAFINDG